MTENPLAIQEKEENKEKLLSTIWQADVLDQTRLRALGTSVNSITDKNLTTQTEAKMANTLIQLKANGRTADQTIAGKIDPKKLHGLIITCSFLQYHQI